MAKIETGLHSLHAQVGGSENQQLTVGRVFNHSLGAGERLVSKLRVRVVCLFKNGLSIPSQISNKQLISEPIFNQGMGRRRKVNTVRKKKKDEYC